jgi:hypothetical protein
MHIPQWLKPGFWGVVVGALGIMIIGFAWGGWFLGSTTERKNAAAAAVRSVSRHTAAHSATSPSTANHDLAAIDAMEREG